uniref:Uncharacterized protein n=1 Tax=Aegilops tauschii subsp. strangulata TaxID=200361 RepID=A0A453Q982_AEGTS
MGDRWHQRGDTRLLPCKKQSCGSDRLGGGCPGSSLESLGKNKGIFGWTGGEDGRLCCWRSDDVVQTKKSWISSTLVSRVDKKTKIRHQPY